VFSLRIIQISTYGCKLKNCNRELLLGAIVRVLRSDVNYFVFHQMHFVHYNRDRYSDVASAVASGESDAVAVVGVWYDVSIEFEIGVVL